MIHFTKKLKMRHFNCSVGPELKIIHLKFYLSHIFQYGGQMQISLREPIFMPFLDSICDCKILTLGICQTVFSQFEVKVIVFTGIV